MFVVEPGGREEYRVCSIHHEDLVESLRHDLSWIGHLETTLCH